MKNQKVESQNSRARWHKLQNRLFNMVSVGVADDPWDKGYDILSTVVLIINLFVSMADTFDYMSLHYGTILSSVEKITVAFFALDYGLRLITAPLLNPKISRKRAVINYILSGAGLIDLASFLPYYLPFFFPSGVVAFRMFRIIRVFRLFRINAYYDSLNVITEVLYSKKNQILSSVFIILVLMLASSLCMYSIEHDAQPEVFKNAFSGIWWASSTLLTVGYGDIYPITPIGEVLGIIIAFLGVGLVAIPTGIISAGFVEQYTRLKRIGDYAVEEDIHFIKVELEKSDTWVNMAIKDIGLPHGTIVAVIQRGSETLIPRGEVILHAGDVLIIGAESLQNDRPINLKEVKLKSSHPWNGVAIRDLDISRQTLIIMIRRNGTSLIPRGSLVLQENDDILLFTKVKSPGNDISI